MLIPVDAKLLSSAALGIHNKSYITSGDIYIGASLKFVEMVLLRKDVGCTMYYPFTLLLPSIFLCVPPLKFHLNILVAKYGVNPLVLTFSWFCK